MKTIAQLEATADAAVRAEDAAANRLRKINSYLDALTMLDDACSDDTLVASERGALDEIDSAKAFVRLTEAKRVLMAEIDRLGDARSDAWAALNGAYEAA